MASTTTKYLIPRPDDIDPLADLASKVRAACDRIDLLLGETGTASINPSGANVYTTVRVDYARSYAGLAPLIPIPIVTLATTPSASTTVTLTAQNPDATGFTLGILSSNTGARNVRWSCKAGTT